MVLDTLYDYRKGTSNRRQDDLGSHSGFYIGLKAPGFTAFIAFDAHLPTEFQSLDSA